MKKSSLAIVSLLAFAGTAHAQSSVTLYGILDEGIDYITNHSGGKQVELDATNGISGSRWGLKGTEDLGGGLKAIFDIESGVNVNTGAFNQGSTPFGRQVWVGLSSASVGTLTLGRQLDSVSAYVEPIAWAASAGDAWAAHPGDLDNLENSVRVNNAIRYASQSYGGFTFGGELSLGGQPGALSEGSGYSVGAAYNNGPLKLGVAYEYFHTPNTDGALVDNVSGASAMADSLNSGYITAQGYQIITAGGAYTFGPATLDVAYSNVQYRNITGLADATATFNDAELGLKWQLTPAVYVGGDYNYTKGNSLSGGNLGNQHYNQFSLITDYALSKRTDVYLVGTYQRAAGTNSKGQSAVADITNFGDASGNNQALIRAALRVAF